MLAAPSRAAGGTGGGKIVWYQRKLLRTAPNRFSSFFFFFGLVSDLSLPSVCWQTTAGPNPVLSCVSCRVPGVSLPAEAGGQAGEGGREGGQVGPPPPPQQGDVSLLLFAELQTITRALEIGPWQGQVFQESV